MLNRRLHRTIVGGIIGIVFFSVAGAWLLINGISLFFAFVCLCLVVGLAILLVGRMERTNRQLENFFVTIRNNDFNIHFAGKKGEDSFLNGLYGEMNRIITRFENNHTELEERRLYYESIIRVLIHEIRNSITPVASLSADLLNYTDEYDRKGMIDGLQTIYSQVVQLNAFLNAYHRLTHLPEPVKDCVNVRTFLGKLERLLSSESGSQSIHYLSPEQMELTLDQHLITLGLINLIRNALQATANVRDPLIVVEAGKETDFSFIQVTDNGDGIPQNRLDDVFAPFYSTKKEGSGIGLPLTKRIMQLHGGKLLVHSEPGERTVFRMQFPQF
ncbi:MAG: HAMP domain-containing sensor histidine kinase [Massilibacteroides sp.]|nr:HAMP domain-containing sensor histidine kinase [Massilibacteroides sp.]MDD3062277.1 HAMP domain-containing sensor histidine kinase [Massilibacteroides sp.]MDD4113984.1 HAMP domain-containing sensor histidine kinase [Massilibacteroides sp.]MDD4660050.1 HAMP domain-containing sensor histidine kinase [Massilibacteroides sp.]